MPYSEESFREALSGKKLAPLTLDNRWYRLFEDNKPPQILAAYEKELNDLIKRQGGLNNEVKELKRQKKALMDEIVGLADSYGQGDKAAGKKLEENKRVIDENNERIEACYDELLDIPRQMDAVNYKLMLGTMEICYARLSENTEELVEIAKWINATRRELKKKLVRKREKEVDNNNLYKYMHQFFGAEVIEIFDIKEGAVTAIKEEQLADEETRRKDEDQS